MTDVFSPQRRSYIMSCVRSKNTSLEVEFRKRLFKLGYRYRINVAGLPGHPDLVLPKYKTIIQINGCFWHGHNCPRVRLPKSNPEYWRTKIVRNKKRDKVNIKSLIELGWSCVLIWECASKQKYSVVLLNNITRFLRSRTKFLMVGENKFGKLAKSTKLEKYLRS
jgi:DNA mismatch endonuclease (patch repair protein)